MPGICITVTEGLFLLKADHLTKKSPNKTAKLSSPLPTQTPTANPPLILNKVKRGASGSASMYDDEDIYQGGSRNVLWTAALLTVSQPARSPDGANAAKVHHSLHFVWLQNGNNSCNRFLKPDPVVRQKSVVLHQVTPGEVVWE